MRGRAKPHVMRTLLVTRSTTLLNGKRAAFVAERPATLPATATAVGTANITTRIKK